MPYAAGKSLVIKNGAKVLRALREGAPTLTAAARLAGLKPKTVQLWMERGRLENAEPAHEAFMDAVEQVQAQFSHKLLKAVVSKVDEDWHAAKFLMETRHPEHYGRKETVTLEVPLLKTYAFEEPAIPEPELRPAEIVAPTNGHKPPTNGNGHDHAPPE